MGWIMAQKDRHTQKMIELGKENQTLIPKIKNWCRHIDIKQFSAGMLAVVTHLPIGQLQVICEYGVPSGTAMNLDWIARDFILANCIQCSYHQELSPENFGRLIIAEKESEIAEKRETEIRRQQLEKELYIQAKATLDTKEVTEGSVNRLILNLYSKEIEDSSELHSQLVEAAQMAPEFFSEKALQVLTDCFLEDFGKVCIQVTRKICKFRKEIPDFVFQMSCSVISNGFSEKIDDAYGIIADYIELNGAQSVLPILPEIISAADYYRSLWLTHGFRHETPHLPNLIDLFHFLFNNEPDAVRAAFQSRLHIDHKETKFNTAKLLLNLLPGEIDNIIPLTRDILRSLELEDDHFEDSADEAVYNLLAHLYVYSPSIIGKEVDDYWQHASGEIKVLLLKMYARISLYAADKDYYLGSLVFDRVCYVQQLPIIFEKLYTAVADIRIEVRLREEICHLLKQVLRDHPTLLSRKLNQFLGRLAITVRELVHITSSSNGSQTGLEVEEQEAAYNSIILRLTEILHELIATNPSEYYQSIIEFLDELNSKTDSRLKSELVKTLSIFGRSYELLPQVIPKLYKYLVDFESVSIRQAAIDVLGTILKHEPQSVPDNMIDLLVEVYLRDSYVAIHRSTIRTLRHFKFSKDERGYLALKRIVAWEEVYFKEQSGTRVFQDIVTTLSSAFQWPEVKQFIVTKLLPKYSKSENRHFAQDMLLSFARQVVDYPEAAPSFLRTALDFLQNTSNDHGGSFSSPCLAILESFYTLPSETISKEIDRFHEVIKAKFHSDPFESFKLLEVLAFWGRYEDIVNIVNDVFPQPPTGKRINYWHENCQLLSVAAQVEIHALQGDLVQAHEVIEKVTSMEDEKVEG